MALPINIFRRVGEQNSYHGPFHSAGDAAADNVSVVLTNSIPDGETILLMRSPNPTSSSFVVEDTLNSPVFGSGTTVDSLWSVQGGEKIHVVGQNDGHDVWYAQVEDLSQGASAIWHDIDGAGDRDILVDSAPIGDDGPNAIACSISAETTGTDIVVAYQGLNDMDMGTAYARIDVKRSTDDGENWGSVIAIDNGGAVHWTGPVIVQGSSDRMHIFFIDDNNNDAYQRTLRSDDSLETFPSAFDAAAGAVGSYVFGRGVAFTSGADTKVRAPYKDADNTLSVVRFNSVDTPSVTTVTGVSDTTAATDIFGLAVDTDVQHLLYRGADADLFRDETGADNDTWGTDTEVLDAVTINDVFPNVYDRSGQKLAYIYDDGGTVKYNEVTLAAVFTPDVDAFRFYSDGTESGSSPKAAEDTNIELDATGDAQFHLRYRIQNTTAEAGAGTDDYALEVSKNSGSYAAVTASSSDVQSDTASGLTADAATTNRATNGISDGTGSFVAGEQEETNGVIENIALTASNFTEHVWACKLIDADLGDGNTLDFRVTLNAGAPGMANSVTPRITTPSDADLSTRRIDLGGDGMLLVSGG